MGVRNRCSGPTRSMTASRERARPPGHGPAPAPAGGQGNPKERLRRSQALHWYQAGNEALWIRAARSPPLLAGGQPAGYLRGMADLTQLLDAAASGDPRAAAELLPLVYDELRRLAAARLSQEAPGQTLDATALVHEAYLRLVGPAEARMWDGRGHFFAAAAEARRRS